MKDDKKVFEKEDLVESINWVTFLEPCNFNFNKTGYYKIETCIEKITKD